MGPWLGKAFNTFSDMFVTFMKLQKKKKEFFSLIKKLSICIRTIGLLHLPVLCQVP